VIALERENPDEPRVRWLSSAIQRQSAIGMQREIEAMEFPDSPEHDPEFDRDGSELGPEPIEFRAMTWGNRMRPVSLEDEAGFEDFPERAGFFRHESQGRSNVLGEFTGVAWVYGLQCHPGLKGLTAVTWRTKEGDELWLNFEVTRNLNDTYEGTYFIVGGTGRLAGARGYGTVRTEQNDRIGPYGVRRGVIWRE
jgi:hypothetical protein